MTTEKPRVVIQKYESGKPVGKPEVVVFDEEKSKEFIKNLEKQPDTTAD